MKTHFVCPFAGSNKEDSVNLDSPLTPSLSPSEGEKVSVGRERGPLAERAGRQRPAPSRLNWLVVVCALAASLLAACATGGAKPPVNTTKYDLENKAPFVPTDSRAQRSVTCSGIQERKLDDGRIEVAANVRNRENRRIQVQINCEFKDEQGFVVDSTPWETLILTENGQESARFTSMNDKARKYTIRVRQAR